jgi:uncharacterized membrane protein
VGMEMVTPGSWIEIGAVGSADGYVGAAFAAVFFLLGAALLLGGLAGRGTSWEVFAGVHEKWGLLVAFASLYWLGFARHFWIFRHGEAGAPYATTWLALGLGLLLATGAAWGALRRSRHEVQSLAPWLVVALLPMLGVVVVGPLGDAGWWWSALGWISLFVLAIGVVKVGLETGREGWVNLGILGIATNVVTRYFDLFGSMLEGGVFFIVTGLLVTTIGIFLEKKRRALVAAMRQEARS